MLRFEHPTSESKTKMREISINTGLAGVFHPLRPMKSLIEILKPEEYLCRYLTGLLKSQVDTLKKLQAPSGMWHTLLDDETSYEETSAAAGFAYGILKGIHMGLLSDEYQEMADKAVEGVMEQIAEDGTVGQVSYGTGMGRDLQHYRDIPICPMAYGQSLVMMMLNEVLAGK